MSVVAANQGYIGVSMSEALGENRIIKNNHIWREDTSSPILTI